MMAVHYAVGVRPASPRRPRDKAKVENGVSDSPQALAMTPHTSQTRFKSPLARLSPMSERDHPARRAPLAPKPRSLRTSRELECDERGAMARQEREPIWLDAEYE